MEQDWERSSSRDSNKNLVEHQHISINIYLTEIDLFQSNNVHVESKCMRAKNGLSYVVFLSCF